MGKKCGLRMSLGGLLDPKRPSTGGPIVTGGIRGYSDMAEGGIVRGKGGPTDDEVPMQVAGKNVNLSNSEAVLPAKTVQALGGPEAVEGLIEQTNGKPPVKGGLREGGAYNGGATNSPQEAWAEHQRRQASAAAQKQAVAQTAARGEATAAALAGDVANTEAAAATLRPAPAAPAAAPPPAPKALTFAGKALRAAGGLAQVVYPAAATIGAARSEAPTLGGKIKEGLSGAEYVTPEQQRQADAVRESGKLPWWAGPGGAMIPNAELAKFGANEQEAKGAGPIKPIPTLTPEQIEAAKAANANVMSGGEGNGQVAPIGLDRKLLTVPPKAGGVLEQKTNLAADKVALAHERNPEIKGLRAAGVTGGVLGDVTVDGKTGPTGIRTIDAANGQKVYAGRDANGQLHVSSTGGLNAAQGDAMRDKQFAAAGYGKDAYGNWMTPQRIAEREQLSGLQKGANQTLGDLIVDKMYARRAGKQQERNLKANEVASLDAFRQGSLINDAQKTASTAKAAAQANYLAASKEQREVVTGYLDKLVPTTGLKDDDLKAAQFKRAQLEEAFWKANGGNLSVDPQETQRQLGPAGDVANNTIAKKNAMMNPSLMDRVNNVYNGNKDRATTMYPTTTKTVDGRIYMPSGPGLRDQAVFGHDADLRDSQYLINKQFAAQK